MPISLANSLKTTSGSSIRSYYGNPLGFQGNRTRESRGKQSDDVFRDVHLRTSAFIHIYDPTGLTHARLAKFAIAPLPRMFVCKRSGSSYDPNQIATVDS